MEIEVVHSSVRWYPPVKSHDCISRKPIMNLEQYVLWVLRPCISETARRFGRIYRLQFYGRKKSEARNQQIHAESLRLSSPPGSADF
jgi:hypothetical protein